MIDEQINLELHPFDFEHDFADPEDCPFVTALKRSGYVEVNAGTLEARAKKGDKRVYIKVESVYLNGKRVDNPAFAFGPVEYRRVKEEFFNKPTSQFFLHLTVIENKQD